MCFQGPPLLQFPEEVIRQILLKLSNDKDLDSVSNSHLLFKEISNENRVWRQLCNYHFTAAQKEQLLQQQSHKLSQKEDHNNVPSGENNNDHVDNLSTISASKIPDNSPQWKFMYKALKRKHGLNREEYAEELNLCKSCGLLFWTASSSNPHDCGMAILIRVKPGDFIKYFCV